MRPDHEADEILGPPCEECGYRRGSHRPRLVRSEEGPCSQWDGVTMDGTRPVGSSEPVGGDFYEEDEPLEKLIEITSRPPDGYTSPPVEEGSAGH